MSIISSYLKPFEKKVDSKSSGEFEKLPNEITQLILSNLSVKDLAKAQEVSKNFKENAQIVQRNLLENFLNNNIHTIDQLADPVKMNKNDQISNEFQAYAVMNAKLEETKRLYEERQKLKEKLENITDDQQARELYKQYLTKLSSFSCLEEDSEEEIEESSNDESDNINFSDSDQESENNHRLDQLLQMMSVRDIYQSEVLSNDRYDLIDLMLNDPEIREFHTFNFVKGLSFSPPNLNLLKATVLSLKQHYEKGFIDRLFNDPEAPTWAKNNYKKFL